ncbi:MAG: penicillin-binding protein 2 [Dehalococcoidales bacterium]
MRRRLLVLILLCGLAWLILLGRLWRLQISQQQSFADLSLNNRIRLKRIKSSRGLVRDSHGAVLVSNRPGFHAALILEDAGLHLEESLATLSRLLDVPLEQFKKKIAKARPKLLPFRPLLLSRHLTPTQVALLEEHQLDLPGITVVVEPVRNYHFGALAAHLLGYVGEITESQLKKPIYQGVRQGDQIGQYGLEKSFDPYLTGEDGGKQIEVNAEGRELQVLGQRQSVPGLNLVLTLDLQLQLKAESLMEGKTGALVALDPTNGEVLAMVSSPNFDPNLLAAGISREQWQEIVEHPNHPLHNRVIQSQYPPGSVFKILVTAAALDQGVVDLQTRHLCLGSLSLGRWTYDCWREGGHGELGIVQAFSRSCNVFFYNLGRELGIERIASYARKFGLGRPSGIDLANEKGGLVPSREWKKRVYGQIWLPGETISLAIGQGYLGVTPLQLANLAAVAANSGTLYRPYLVKRIVSAGGQVERVFHPEVLGKVNLKPEHWQILRRGMRGVVNSERGTGRRARIPGLDVSGKTGTAQVVAKRPDDEEKIDEEDLPEELRDHAWFVAFAPGYGTPRIALAILVEHGGHGGSACAPLARELIQEYLSLRFPHLLEEAKIKARQAWLKAKEARLQEAAETPSPALAPAQVSGEAAPETGAGLVPER